MLLSDASLDPASPDQLYLPLADLPSLTSVSCTTVAGFSAVYQRLHLLGQGGYGSRDRENGGKLGIIGKNSFYNDDELQWNPHICPLLICLIPYLPAFFVSPKPF